MPSAASSVRAAVSLHRRLCARRSTYSNASSHESDVDSSRVDCRSLDSFAGLISIRSRNFARNMNATASSNMRGYLHHELRSHDPYVMCGTPSSRAISICVNPRRVRASIRSQRRMISILDSRFCRFSRCVDSRFSIVSNLESRRCRFSNLESRIAQCTRNHVHACRTWVGGVESSRAG